MNMSPTSHFEFRISNFFEAGGSTCVPHGWLGGAAQLVAGILSREQLLSLLRADNDAFDAAMPQEAYLYHTLRRDLRHNFSPLYYPAYLNLGDPALSALLGR